MRKIIIAVLSGLIGFGIGLYALAQVQAMLFGVIVFLVVLWSNGGLSLGVTSLLPIILFPLFGFLNIKATTINYAHPIIYLFLGGFMVAIAVEKTNLHKYIVAKMLKIFPNTPRGMIFSLSITSAILSSILSNTTTTLLLISVALFISDEIKLKMRFALAVAYGASIGGIITPIGTPPNLILLGILSDKSIEAIAFAKWVYMVLPLSILMLITVGSVLSFGIKEFEIKIQQIDMKLNAEQKKVLFILFGLIVTLFLNAPIKPYWNGLGLSDAMILLSAGLLLFTPFVNILQWESDAKKIPYEIMFLFGAGFSIAKAFSATKLADVLASWLISMVDISPIALLFCIAILITFTTEITSNTALTSMMLPVIYSVAEQMGINTMLFMMVATICASYAFMLPIATPPNAIAMSTKAVKVSDMIKFGLLFNVVGILLIVLVANFYWKWMI